MGIIIVMAILGYLVLIAMSAVKETLDDYSRGESFGAGFERGRQFQAKSKPKRKRERKKTNNI